MVKIRTTQFYLHLIYLCLLVSSCIEKEHVFLENNTGKIITVQVFLLTKNGEQILETNINPNHSDGWSYEVDPNKNFELDKKFIKLIITNNTGCKVEINRKEMNKYIVKSGAWKLNIDSSIINC